MKEKEDKEDKEKGKKETEDKEKGKEKGKEPSKESESTTGDKETPIVAVAPKKGKMMIIIIAMVLLLISIGAGIYFSGILHKKSDKPEAATEEGAKKPETEEKPEEKHKQEEPAKDSHKEVEVSKDNKPVSLYKNLDDFLVDLKANNSGSFIKIDVTLKVDKQESLGVIDAKMPEIRDSFITYLRELKTDDVQGSGGLFTLKQELLMRINKIIAPAMVEEIYIQNILTR